MMENNKELIIDDCMALMGMSALNVLNECHHALHCRLEANEQLSVSKSEVIKMLSTSHDLMNFCISLLYRFDADIND